jgi:hypothetical protein
MRVFSEAVGSEHKIIEKVKKLLKLNDLFIQKVSYRESPAK